MVLATDWLPIGDRSKELRLRLGRVINASPQAYVISLAAPVLITWLGAVNPDAGAINQPAIDDSPEHEPWMPLILRLWEGGHRWSGWGYGLLHSGRGGG